jgi:hypothetical protein
MKKEYMTKSLKKKHQKNEHSGNKKYGENSQEFKLAVSKAQSWA